MGNFGQLGEEIRSTPAENELGKDLLNGGGCTASQLASWAKPPPWGLEHPLRFFVHHIGEKATGWHFRHIIASIGGFHEPHPSDFSGTVILC